MVQSAVDEPVAEASTVGLVLREKRLQRRIKPLGLRITGPIGACELFQILFGAAQTQIFGRANDEHAAGLL